MDRSRTRTGHGPENTTLLRRFAIGLIKARGLAVAETMRRLGRDARRVPGFLKMTDDRQARHGPRTRSIRHQDEWNPMPGHRIRTDSSVSGRKNQLAVRKSPADIDAS